MMDRNTLILLHFVAYTLGLIATFVSLFLMNSAQPALLYLVPFTLIPVFVVSIIRGDFAAMWQGDYDVINSACCTFQSWHECPCVFSPLPAAKMEVKFF